MYRRRLSTIWTFPCKFVLPVLHVLATDALALVLYVDGIWPRARAALHTAMPDPRMQALAWAVWFLLLAVGAWNAWRIKQVETDGENLFISNFRQEIRVPIASLIDVRQNLWSGSGLVWLLLEETPAELLPWGRRIAFMPTARMDFGFKRYQPHPIVAELLNQSAQARRARGMARIQQIAAGALGRRGGFGYTPRS